MFVDFLKNVLTFIGRNGDTLAMYNDGDDIKFTLNENELDLSIEENVKKAYDIIDAFANNPIFKTLMTKGDINKMVDSAKERINAIHQSAISEAPEDATEDATEDTNKFEDDAHYVANAYLEDTVDGWEDVPEDKKNRSINALANFFNWMKVQADND